MARYTEAQNKATQKYKSREYKRIPLDIRKEDFPAIQSAAAAAGESVNGYIKKAIRLRMEQEKSGP